MVRTCLMGLMLVLLPHLALAVAVDETPLEDPVLEAQARDIMAGIRCLVCQNQSIEDSNADLAKDLRRIVREQVLLGKSGRQVREYLVQRYGDWILMKPPLNALTLWLWATPFLLILLGGTLAFFFFRHRETPALKPLTLEEKARIAALLDGDKP